METRILELAQIGDSRREIAAKLGRSRFTIDTHLHRILEKTRSRNTCEAIFKTLTARFQFDVPITVQ